MMPKLLTMIASCMLRPPHRPNWLSTRAPYDTASTTRPVVRTATGGAQHARPSS